MFARLLATFGILLALLPRGAFAVLPPDRLVVPITISEGSSFGPLVEAWGLPSAPIREAALSLHDLALIRPSSELAVELVDGEALPVAVHYAIDEDRVLIVRRESGAWQPAVEEVVYTVREETLVLRISSSLWEAGMEAGLRPQDLTRLARIYEYDVDFNTEIQPGATVALVGEVRSTEGRPDKLGTLHAVRLVNGAETIEMIRFPDPDGREGWWHPDGTSAVRAFLRSPLEFSHVTSGFNPRRFHPILKERRPHNGTDFGAPSGTPVRAVADGRVAYAGNNGGHGQFVKLQHVDGYETSYSHLSSISVRLGQTVTQGQLIGRVGTTGLSTGPHLHFQMWKKGRFVDPMHEVPKPTRPLEASQKAAFLEQVARWLPKVPMPEAGAP